MCPMSGMNPAFIPAQIGHSVQVLLSTCAEWIGSVRDWTEVNKPDRRECGSKRYAQNPGNAKHAET